MERLHCSSCLKTLGHSRFFVPSRFMKVVTCNNRFETETKKRWNEFVPTYAKELILVHNPIIPFYTVFNILYAFVWRCNIFINCKGEWIIEEITVHSVLYSTVYAVTYYLTLDASINREMFTEGNSWTWISFWGPGPTE
jgi:hypothetical protein